MSTAAAVDREKPNGPRSRKGAATRVRLLEAAKVVFEEDGFLEARITDIAERAGLSHGSFYHYFDSKEQIFHEVAVSLIDLLHAPLSAVIFDPSSKALPRERILESNRRYLASYRKEARIIGIIEEVSRYDDRLGHIRFEHLERDRSRIANSIIQLQERGFADPGLDPNIAAHALGAMVSRFAEMWFVQRLIVCSFDNAVEQLTHLFINALVLQDVPRTHPAAT